MTSLRTLKREARESATWRGHSLSRFHTYTTAERRAVAHCRNCPASVVVDCYPAPNGIDIGGDAVAVNCEPDKWRRLDNYQPVAFERYASYPGFSFERIA